MTEISLNEDSFSSWHTCPEDSKYKSDNGSTKNNKTSNENILKDLNLDLDNSDDESIVEFEKFVDQSDAFNKLKEFKENTSNEDFLRPVTPSGSLRRENSPSLYPNFVRPKYLSDQQNVSLADKLTPANNIHKNVVEITPTEIPTTKINNEKVSNTLTVPNVNNLLSPLNQSSALTLVDTDNQEYDITMPGGSLAIFDNSKVDLKNDINNIKENIKDKKNDIKEDIKDKKNDIKETIKDTKEKIIENVNNTNDKLHSNSEDDENQGENQGTLGRFFSYFRGFGKADNNESANNENLTNEKKNKPVTENKNQKTLIETVEALGSPSNVYTNIPGLLPTESVVTVVNDSEEDYDDDDEFANALDSAPENVINTKQHDFANTKVSTTVTLNNPTDISINGNEAVVEEIVVIQNPDGTETTAKKVIYTVDENGNQNPIKTIVYNDDVDLDAYNNQAYHDPNANVYNKQIITPNINNNNVTTTTQDDAVIEEEQSITSSEDFVDAITASHNNTLIQEEKVQYPQNVPPMALSFREGTVKKIQHNHLEKKSSSHTLKSTTSLNVELVPVNKPHETIDVTSARPNYFGLYEENSSSTITATTTAKPPRKAHRKKSKQKKRKWYHKIFKFSICTRHEDY